MTYGEALRKEVFRSWFLAVILFYNFTVLPSVLFWFAGAGAAQFLLFADLWVAVSLIMAWGTGRFVVYDVMRKNRYQKFATQNDNMRNAAEFGLKLAQYLNPPGLVYAALSFVGRKIKRPLLRGCLLLYAYTSLACEYVSLVWRFASLVRENLSPSEKNSME